MSNEPVATDAVARSEELRLALVLNGGVSLAVWMGGVAFELNRLVRETHPVYRGLLELTGTAARIDVISGASAGGINGAALALAQVHDSSLYSLRDVWLNTAGLEQLMRKPDELDPSSILRGDTWFLPRIRRAFAEIAGGTPPSKQPADPAPVMLSLATTLLDGVGVRRLDDFGAVVEDTVHRARWRFERNGGRDAFTDANIVDQLAQAARATASFPIAFEPTLFDPKAPMFAGVEPLQVRLSPDRAVSESTLLLDGGILDNRPFDAALDCITKLPAQGTTRRVLAYIVPDPAGAAERRQPDEHTGKLPDPTLAQVAWRSLVGIPASQSITSNLESLRKANDDASRRWQRIVGAMRHTGATVLMQHAVGGLEAYRARRVDGITDYLLGEIEVGLAAGRVDRDLSLRRATRQWLRSTWQATSTASPDDGTERMKVWDNRVPTVYAPGRPLLMGPEPRWPWGLYAVQFIAELTIELLRRTQRLHGLVERWVAGAQAGGGDAKASVAGPAIATACELAAGSDWEDQDQSPSPVGQVLAGGGQRVGDKDLKPIWEEAFARARGVDARRRQANVETETIGAVEFAKLVDDWTLRDNQTPPADLALAMLDKLLCISPEDEATNAADAYALCRLIWRLHKPMRDIARAAANAKVRGDIAEAVADLDAISHFLFSNVPGDAGQRVDRIAWHILSLEVFEVSASSRTRVPSAQAEVVQISARLRSAWGGSSDPADKVNGMQLAHFGAFYKRSWRANDWTFGRLDGIDRAVRIALNPDALQRRFGRRNVVAGAGGAVLPASQYVARFLHGLAVAGAEPELSGYLDTCWQGDAAKIKKELSWLDDDATLPPPLLEACASALTRRLQLEALRRELPEIAVSLLTERSNGAWPSAAGDDLLTRVDPGRRPPARDAIALVANNLLGADTLADQQGTDLFTRTASQGLATAHAALSSRHGGFNAIQIVFKVTEWPLRILYWLTNRLARGSSTAAALEGGTLGVGVALVGASLLSEKVPPAVVGFGWALLLGVIVATLLRQLLLGAVMLALVLAGALALQAWTVVALVLGSVVVLLLLSTRWGAVLASAVVVLGAAWWSGGGSLDAAHVLWHHYVPGAGPPHGEMTALRTERAERLALALEPAIVLVALLLVSALSRALVFSARRAGASRGWPQASVGLRAALEQWWAKVRPR